MNRARPRKPRSKKTIAERVRKHKKLERQRAAPANVVVLNRGFFELERMRARQRAVKEK